MFKYFVRGVPINLNIITSTLVILYLINSILALSNQPNYSIAFAH